MAETRFVVTIRDDIAAEMHRLRIDDRVAEIDVSRFLELLSRKYRHLSGLSLRAFVGDRELDPGDKVAEALGSGLEGGVVVRVALDITEEVDVEPPSAADATVGPARGSGPVSSTPPAGPPSVTADRIATTLLSLIASTPARFHEKNRRVLDRVVAGRDEFARMGPILVNWCDDDFACFDEDQRGELKKSLVWFVLAAAENPRDAAYSAVLAASHVTDLLPWDDVSFCVALSTVVNSLHRHVRGGEGTAHMQRALARLKTTPGLPADVRETLGTTHDSLWKGRPEAGPAKSASRDDDLPGRSWTDRDQVASRDSLPTIITRSRKHESLDLLAQSRGRVALLIDLENLVYGLRAQYGDDQVNRLMNYGALYRFASEFGDVCIVNAYADWKYRIMNQFQRDLYDHGVELIHVIGKGRKNAADLRMAIDLTAMLWTHPEIEVVVIVSGDRDFIEILKELRRHGKRIVGVANHYSVNRQFALLFDVFAPYREVLRRFAGDDGGSLRQAPDRRGEEGLSDLLFGDESAAEWGSRRSSGPLSEGSESDPGTVRQPTTIEDVADALREVFVESGGASLKGARIKPLLRSKLGAGFHERDFGFSSMSALLRAIPAVARIVEVEGGGDVVVLRADSSLDDAAVENLLEGAAMATVDPIRALVKESGLGAYRYETDRRRRREILATIHGALTAGDTFTWEGVCEAVCSVDTALSSTILSRYQSILYQSHLFTFEPGEAGGGGVPLRRRQARIDPRGESLDGLVRGYESGVVRKVLERIDRDVSLEEVRGLLGFAAEGFEVDDEGYCEALMAEARSAIAASGSNQDDAGRDPGPVSPDHRGG